MFDIYGNNLKAGHCEVHPHVAQPYPCSACTSEQRERDSISRLQQASYIGHEMDLIEKIEHVRNVLGIVGDQQTVNLAGDIQQEVEELMANKKDSCDNS